MGKRSGNYGHPVDDETRRKISESVKKRWQDKKYKDKVSKAHSHPLPDSWKQNISNGMTGIKRPVETRKKMSIAQKENQKRIANKRIKSWKKQWNSLSKEEQLERLQPWIEAGHKAIYRDGVKFLKPSKIEIIVKEQLDSIGIKYVQQKHLYDNKNDRHYFADFYIPSLKLVIECNGDYWHSFDDKKKRDKEFEKFVKRTKHKIIFIWEHEIKDDWFWIGDYLDAEEVM